MSASSSSLEREIDEYQDVSSRNGGNSYESSKGGIIYSSDSSSLDEYYLSRVLGFPLKDFQEMQRRMTFEVEASLSRRSLSPPQDEEEEANVIYSCAPEVASTLDANKLKTFVGRYQIPNKFRPHLLEEGEWCCFPFSGFGVYTSYLLTDLRFPLNSFCRGLFHRLGIGTNQLNPNGWRTIVALQVLWVRRLMGTVQS